MSFSFRQIRYFVATAEHGQVSQAATELAISQSAITAAIKDLEASIGVLLFHRSQQGMELTMEGRQFLCHAYSILDKVSEARNFRPVSRDLSGTVSIAATCTVLAYFLPAHLGRLKRRFPNLKLRLMELAREAIVEGLLTNRLDMAVVLSAEALDPSLETECLLRARRRLWTPVRHPLLEVGSVGLAEISREPCIMLTIDEAAQQTLWSGTGCQPQIWLRTSSVEAARSMVANGDGVAILSDMVYRPWSLEGKRVETALVSGSIPDLEVGLTWSNNVEFSPQMDAFRAYFRQAFMLPERL